MTRRALIGHTGFVGSNLDRQLAVTDRYNSRNVGEMRGQSYDEIVCAGVRAVKWWANQNPEADWAGIVTLLDALSGVKAGRFTLISTVDVYRDPVGVDEATLIDAAGLHPYGLHRWRVEDFVRRTFANAQIVRLPGLFGPGLKKNLIYDVMTGGDLSGFDARSSFQFYDLARLGHDLAVAGGVDAPVVNLAVEPVTVSQVVGQLTGDSYAHHTARPPVRYDFRTRFAAAWGREGGYVVTAAECLAAIGRFARAGSGGPGR